MGKSRNTIFAEKTINRVVLSHKQTHRSNFFISLTKHCFEATLNSGCVNTHIGFSPNKTTRSFVSFSQYSDKSRFVDYCVDAYDARLTCDLRLSIGDTAMVCLDSMSKTFSVIYNDKNISYVYPNAKYTGTWYAMIDTEAVCGVGNPADVLVNLGKRTFVNKMPDGYYSFIYGLSDYDCYRTIACRTKRSLNNALSVLILLVY